jgi:hypothetical protein
MPWIELNGFTSKVKSSHVDVTKDYKLPITLEYGIFVMKDVCSYVRFSLWHQFEVGCSKDYKCSC